MQKYILGTGLALLGTVASAQSSLTLYGVVDVAVEHLTNTVSKTDPTPRSLTSMPGLTGSVPSRFGLRGSEDLGGGLRAGFTLESGFGADSGSLNQGGRMFGRQAFVNLSGNWGSVMLGRQYTMLFHGLLGSDILGPNTFGSGSIDAYIPNARADNAIGYLGTFSGVTVGATFSTGRDTVKAGPTGSPAGTNCAGENAADEKACREWSALVKYDSPTWGAALAVDEIRGGTADTFGGLINSDRTDRRISLGGYAKVGSLKLGAGLLSRDNDGSSALKKDGITAATRSDLWYVGASYPVTPKITVDGQVFHLKYKDSADKALMFALRGTYALSKRTAVYATAGSIDNSGAQKLSVSNGTAGAGTLAGGNQLGFATGIRHSF